MTQIDHDKLGQSIAKSMVEGGHVKTAVKGIIYPILETHKREIIEANKKAMITVATQMGVDCDNPLDMQKDMAHLRTRRVEYESTVRKVREWGLRGIFVAMIGYLGFDKFM